MPKVLVTIHDSKYKTYNEQLKRIETASELYATEKSYELIYVGNVATISLLTLINSGYVDEPVVNPKTGINFDYNTVTIEITRSGDVYTTEVIVE